MGNMDNNSILEDSLIDYNSIVGFISKNSEGIVKDTITEKMAQGIKKLIIEADEPEEDSVEDQDNKGLDDTDSEPEDKSQSENKPEEFGADLDDNSEEDTDSMTGDGMEPEIGDEPIEGDDDEEDFDFDKFKTGEDEYDLTNSSIEDVVKVFKRINDDDSVIVKELEDGKVELVDNETGADYVIDMGDLNGEGDDDDDDTVEIEFDESDGMSEEDESDSMDEITEEISEIELEGAEDLVDEKNMTQSIGTNRRAGRMTQTRKDNAPGANNRDGAKLIANESKKIASIYMAKVKQIEEAYTAKFQEINEEVEKYKNALDLFRNKLKEQAVLNNNLAKYVKLVTENATSKDEKLIFLKRFSEEANTIESGNRLFESIQSELSSKGTSTINININDKGTIKGNITESSNNINEKVIYQSKDLQDTIALINRMNGL